MKKMMLLMAVLWLGCCTASFARTDFEKSKVAVLKHNDVVRLFYEGPTTSLVEVSIKDNKGREIFNEEIKAKSFSRPYNFSKLPRGDYEIDVVDSSGKHIERIRYYDRAYLGRVTKLNDSNNKYLVAIPKKGNNEVTVCVYDSQGNLVFTEEVEDQAYAKIYSLKNIKDASIEIFDRD